MGRINSKKRTIHIKIARNRRVKLDHLRHLYQTSKSEIEKEKILEKLAKIAPWLSQKELLNPTSLLPKNYPIGC